MIADLCRKASGSPWRAWELWRQPVRLRVYAFVVNAAALAALAGSAASTRWHVRDVLVFAALACSAAVTVEATRKIGVAHGTIFRDMRAAWYIVAVTLLPPCYVMLLPLAMVPVNHTRMAPGFTYRRVFSGSVCALAYGCAAVVFSRLHHLVTVNTTGSGSRVALWLAALAVSGALGLAINNALILVAIKFSDPAAHIRRHVFERDALVTDLCQLTLATLIALPAAFSPFLLVIALPVVVVMRRLMMHAQLVTAARIDAKTGLLNAATWHVEAELEVSRATRIGSPLAIAIADIDHFKAVNDQHGHLVGDAVLSLLSAAMSGLLRDYDLLGRFGGEEFAICLPHTSPEEALQVAERLREKISLMGTEAAGALPVNLTISVGVASVELTHRTLDELLAAADAALYRAKAAGRNCVLLSREERLRSTG